VAKCRRGAGGSTRQSVSDCSNGQVKVWGYLGDFSLPAIEEVGGGGGWQWTAGLERVAYQ
jgi:hypothetical protein